MLNCINLYKKSDICNFTIKMWFQGVCIGQFSRAVRTIGKASLYWKKILISCCNWFWALFFWKVLLSHFYFKFVLTFFRDHRNSNIGPQGRSCIGASGPERAMAPHRVVTILVLYYKFKKNISYSLYLYKYNNWPLWNIFDFYKKTWPL